MTNSGAIDHVAVAVRSLEQAWRLFGEILGGTFIAGGDDDRLKIRTIQIMLPPGVKIELMQPIDDSSYLHAFIEKHGEGFHHVTTFFEDLPALVESLDAAGFTTVDNDYSDPGWAESFIRPSEAFGALFQNVQTDQDWTVPHDHISLEDVLAGNVVWDGANTWLRGGDG